MVTRLLASLLGLAFLAVAALGVVPNEWTGPGKPLDFGMAHSVIHLIFGILLLFGVWLAVHPRFVLRALGLLYVVVAVIGADRIGEQLVQLYNGVAATRWLELALALALVVLGFMAGGLMSKRPARATAPAVVKSEAADETVEEAWEKAEAAEKAAEKTPANTAVAASQTADTADAEERPERVVDRIKDALAMKQAEDTSGEETVRDLDEAGEKTSEREGSAESRGFGLFGPKPQPQS